MSKVSVSKTINAPTAKVWEMVSEWGGTHKWIPGVGPVSVEGAGVGSVRSAELDPATGFSGRISERLEAFDEAGKYFRYCVIGDSPIPISDYVAEMKVIEQGAAACEVTWSSTWEVNGDISEKDMLAAFDGLYGLALDNVKSALE